MSIGTLSAEGANLVARAGILRYSTWDACLILAALIHGIVLAVVPVWPVIAVGLWWNANTVSHNFIHLPFFRYRLFNRLFALYLSLLLGFPQAIWQQRHLAHHADRKFRLRWTRQTTLQTGLVAAFWSLLGITAPTFFFTVYIPGWLMGMALCYLQGHYEHVRGTVSYYGLVYNWLFFNDGLHAEHHARPWVHWQQLAPGNPASVSRWPAVARMFESLGLNGLEKLLFHSSVLRRFVLERHEHALRALLPRLAAVQHILIVGGGLFPRSAMLLQKYFPDAQLTVIDAAGENIDRARPWVDERVEFVKEFYHPSAKLISPVPDLIVIPLAYRGDRAVIYKTPPARYVLVHDWCWRRRGVGALVSFFLLKRLNLVEP